MNKGNLIILTLFICFDTALLICVIFQAWVAAIVLACIKLAYWLITAFAVLIDDYKEERKREAVKKAVSGKINELAQRSRDKANEPFDEFNSRK